MMPVVRPSCWSRGSAMSVVAKPRSIQASSVSFARGSSAGNPEMSGRRTNPVSKAMTSGCVAIRPSKPRGGR